MYGYPLFQRPQVKATDLSNSNLNSCCLDRLTTMSTARVGEQQDVMRLPPHESVAEASVGIDEYLSAQHHKLQIDHRVSKSSSLGKLLQKGAHRNSGELQTNPTFVSIHEADPESSETPALQVAMNTGGQTSARDLLCTRESQAGEQRVFVWGSNDLGQLGLKNGQYGRLETPQSITFHQKIQQVSCGLTHTAMVTFAKQLYVMGSNKQGQLGLGSSDIQKCTVPTLVQSLAHIQVMSVDCGARHTLAIGTEIVGDRKSAVYSWGDNSKGQTGLLEDDLVLEPFQVEFPNSQDLMIDKIAAGSEHSFFLDTKNWAVYACGEARQGQLGVGRCQEIAPTPVHVSTLVNERVVQVSCGEYHTLALNYEGRVLVTGSNTTGQLGLGHTESQHDFQKVPELTNILHVGASTHSAAVDCDGRLFRWGQGVKGMYLAPLKIASPRPIFIDSISLGGDFGVVKNKNGEVFTYGANSSGQLGLGDTESRSTLNSLNSLNQLGKVQNMAAGQSFVVCLVDTIQQESRPFLGSSAGAADEMPETDPTHKQTKTYAQRTSVTEFQEFDKQELFVIMSEGRGGANGTGNFDSKPPSYFNQHSSIDHSKLLKPRHFSSNQVSKSHADQSDDIGTIVTHNTRQNALEKHAIQHESSQEYLSQAAATGQRPHITDSSTLAIDVMPASAAQQRADAVPPYTSSPFQVYDRRDQMMASRENVASAKDDPQSQAQIGSGVLYAQQTSATNRQSQEQRQEDPNIAQRYQLRSEFARSQSHSRSPRNSRNNQADPSSDYAQRADTINNLNRNAVAPDSRGLPPPSHAPLRRSQSPRGKKVHQQLPSFSMQAPSQFRSKSTLNMPSGRRNQATSQSLENTGQFVSAYAQRLLAQARETHTTHVTQNRHQRHSLSTHSDNKAEDNAQRNTFGNVDDYQDGARGGPVPHHNRSESLGTNGSIRSSHDNVAQPHLSNNVAYQNLMTLEQMTQGAATTIGGDKSSLGVTREHQFGGHFNQTTGSTNYQQWRQRQEEPTVLIMSQKEQMNFLEQSLERQSQSYSQNTYSGQKGGQVFSNRTGGGPLSGHADGHTPKNNQSNYRPLRDHHSGSRNAKNYHRTDQQAGDPRDSTSKTFMYEEALPSHQAHHCGHQNLASPFAGQNNPSCDHQAALNLNQQPHQMTTGGNSTLLNLTTTNNSIETSLETSTSCKHKTSQIVPFNQSHNQSHHLPHHESSIHYTRPFPQAVLHHEPSTHATVQNLTQQTNNCLNCQREGSQLPSGVSASASFDNWVSQQNQQEAYRLAQRNQLQTSQVAATEAVLSRSRSRPATCHMCRPETRAESRVDIEGNCQHAGHRVSQTRNQQIDLQNKRLSAEMTCHSCAAHKAHRSAKRLAQSADGGNKYRRLAKTQGCSVAQSQVVAPQQPVAAAAPQSGKEERKLRKKYKKLKQETQKIVMVQQSEAEKLKLRIHELQTMLHQRDQQERHSDMQKSEGYQQLVSKYTKEISVLREQLLSHERTILAREHQVKVLQKDNACFSEKIVEFKTDLQAITEENRMLKEQNDQMSTDLDSIARDNQQKERRIDLLSEQLGQQTDLCSEAEKSMLHLNKTLDDLKNSFEGAKVEASKASLENDRVHLENANLNSQINAYVKQIANLQQFIDELEGNNKELVRFIDQKNMDQANEYKSKVYSLLGKKRSSKDGSAPLRAQAASIDEAASLRTSQQGRPPNSGVGGVKSQSPAGRTHAVRSVPPEALDKVAQIAFQSSTVQTSSAENVFVDGTLSPAAYRTGVSVGRHLDGDSQEKTRTFQTQQQQANMRRKSHPRSPFGKPLSSRYRQQQPADNTSANGLKSLSPDRKSHQRLSQMVEQERSEVQNARKSLPQAIQQAREYQNRTAVSPTGSYLARKAGDLIERVTQFQKKAATAQRGLDPRDRLKGTRQKAPQEEERPRSVSPAQILHRTSYQSVRSREVRSKSRHSLKSSKSPIHNRSSLESYSISQGANNVSQQHGPQHLNSVDSFMFQYQKVNKNGTSVDEVQPTYQQMVSWHTPNVKKVQPSPPARSKSPRDTSTERPSAARHNVRNHRASEPEIFTLQQKRNSSDHRTETTVEAGAVSVFPKVTSSMMRSQLSSMNQSLAELKRSRVQLEGSIQIYEASDGRDD